MGRTQQDIEWWLWERYSSSQLDLRFGRGAATKLIEAEETDENLLKGFRCADVVTLGNQGEAPALVAETNSPFAFAFKFIFPLVRVVTVYVSQLPAVVRLAISGDAPALSAQTYSLLLDG